jgi:hypothetical protein
MPEFYRKKRVVSYKDRKIREHLIFVKTLLLTPSLFLLPSDSFLLAPGS